MREFFRRTDARFPGWISLGVAVILWASLTTSNTLVQVVSFKLTLLVLMALGVAFCLLRFAYRQRFFWGPLLGFLLLFLTSADLISSFAELYQQTGLVGPDGTVVAGDESHEECLYFSIVTFTTLGYGDFYPVDDCRLLAATEAVLGYIYFGLTIAILFDLVQRRRDWTESEEADTTTV
jgi:hypothetical protein